MTFRKLIIAGGIAAVLAGCSNDSYEQTAPASLISPAAAASQAVTPDTSDDIIAQLRGKYGIDAAKYAARIIDNGKRIRESPDKQKHLYNDIERDLKRRFPLIQPPKLFGYFDEEREAENVARLYTARQRVLPRARKDGIDLPMSFIAAALCNEGHSLEYPESETTDGFGQYGLDTFGNEFNDIVERGYLPKSFRERFTTVQRVNEAGRTVRSAEFSTQQDAFEAFVATLAHRQYLFKEDLRKNKINPASIPKEQTLFFTYKYYNGGPDSAEGLLKKRSAKEIDRFFDRVMTYGSTGNAYVVLSGSQWLDRAGAFDQRPQGKYWWS